MPRQLITPLDLIGRVSATNIMAYGARPIGALLGAGIGAFHSTELCLVVAAAGFVLQATLILISPVVCLARGPDAQ